MGQTRVGAYMLALAFVIHFVADFLLQSREMGKKKSSDYSYLAMHLSIQFLCFLPFFGFKFALYNALIHGVIDKNIWNLYKVSVYLRDKKATPETWKYYDDHWFYSTIGLDQLLHALTIIYLVKYLV